MSCLVARSLNRFTGLLCFCIIIFGGMLAVAAEDTSPDAISELVTKIKLEREELVSGSFDAITNLTRTRKDGSKTIVVRKYSCLFDKSTGRLRFTSKGDMESSVNSISELTPEVQESIRNRTFKPTVSMNQYEAIIVKSKEYHMQWFGLRDKDEHKILGSNVTLWPTDKHIPDPDGVFFDINLAGMLEPLRDGIDRPFHKEFERFSKTPPNTTPSISREVPGVIKLSYHNNKVSRNIFINENAGMTVEKMNVVLHDTIGNFNPGDLKLQTEAKWKNVKGAWVPIIMSGYFAYNDKTRISYKCDFDWKSVNTNSDTIPDSKFTYESFDEIWKGALVIDHRSGEHVHVDTIKMPYEKILTEKELAEKNSRRE